MGLVGLATSPRLGLAVPVPDNSLRGYWATPFFALVLCFPLTVPKLYTISCDGFCLLFTWSFSVSLHRPYETMSTMQKGQTQQAKKVDTIVLKPTHLEDVWGDTVNGREEV